VDEAAWCVRLDEECIRVSQEVVDCVPFWQHPHGAERVHVVVSSANTQVRNHQTLCDELQLARDDELQTAESNLQAALINKTSDVDQCVFQRGLVQVGRNARSVCKGAARSQWVVRCAQCLAVTTSQSAASEGVVQDGSSFDLLGVCHGASQCTGVTRTETIVEVILDRFFSQRECKCNRFVVVASSVRFVGVIEADRRTLGFVRRRAEARQHNFFLECTIR